MHIIVQTSYNCNKKYENAPNNAWDIIKSCQGLLPSERKDPGDGVGRTGSKFKFPVCSLE